MPRFDLEDTHDNAVYMNRRAGLMGCGVPSARPW